MSKPGRNEEFAWNEYALLQSKIDRIGEFKFRIRGWAATIVLGAALVGGKDHSAWLIGGVLGIALAGFVTMESHQEKLSRVFSLRASIIEIHMRQSRDIVVPGISRQLRLARKISGRRPIIQVDASAKMFYFVLVLSVAATCLSRSGATRSGVESSGGEAVESMPQDPEQRGE